MTMRDPDFKKLETIVLQGFSAVYRLGETFYFSDGMSQEIVAEYLMAAGVWYPCADKAGTKDFLARITKEAQLDAIKNTKLIDFSFSMSKHLTNAYFEHGVKIPAGPPPSRKFVRSFIRDWKAAHPDAKKKWTRKKIGCVIGALLSAAAIFYITRTLLGWDTEIAQCLSFLSSAPFVYWGWIKKPGSKL